MENGEGLPRTWAAAGAAAVSVGAASGHRSRSGHECHVSRVTRLQLRVFVTTVVLMLSRAWSRVRAARREAAERAVARARSWLQPSPAQPSPAQPSPAQPSPAPHLELEPETWTREAVVAATAALHQ